MDLPLSEPILTERLELVPMTPAFLRASLNREIPEAERELQAALPADWPGEIAGVLALRLKQLERNPELQPWLLRAMILRETRTMVGHIGFHTAPGPDYLEPYSPGAVEFGFTVFPAYRRRGLTREASRALMQWARESHGVQNFILTISPGNLPSQSLAAQLGFIQIGSHIDDVAGPEDVLEYRMPDAAV
jgi:RimJ/RimL family protein N-acetyltransferase